MRKRFILTTAVALLSVAATMAIPAHRRPVSVTQPDGTQLTVQLVGDEWNHFYRTTDGYTLAKDKRGYYTYARLNAAMQIVPTQQAAHNAEERGHAETAFVATLQRYVTPAMTPDMKLRHDREMQDRNAALSKTQAMSQARRATTQSGGHKAPSYDYSNFRGLIVLVEYNDLSFSRSDYPDLLDGMVNTENYTGYTGTNRRQQRYTGSVRDYFRDNSGGLFEPQFDIVGPVSVDYSAYDGGEKAPEIFLQALQRADATVDYSLYDGDNNGEVDMVFFMVPGYSASYGGNDEALLWPHASSLAYYRQRHDGKRFGRYACSAEMYGWSNMAGNENYSVIDGIGTICHEFSHVLGIMDHYDTNYEAGGQSFDPGPWDIMAGGSDGDRGRQPVGYSLYEKTAMGFTEPITVSQGDTVTLHTLDDTHTGYRIPSGQNKETFYLENRQQTAKWGRYLPGHGLLVWRIDSTSNNVYYQNTLNANPNHNYVEIVRATPGANKQSSAGDPFPGSGRVTELTNDTQPANLLSWTGKECTFELEDISETVDISTYSLVVNFIIADTRLPRPARSITLPPTVTVSAGMTYQLEATVKPTRHTSTLTWSSSDTNVATVGDDGRVTGQRAGLCTITAETDNGLTASCIVIVEQDQIVQSAAEFLDLTDGTNVRLMLRDVQVLVCMPDDDLVYVRDDTGAFVMSGTGIVTEPGCLLSGSIFCQRTTGLNGLPTLEAVEGRTDLTNVSLSQGPAPEPIRVQMADLTQQHLAQLVELWGYQIQTGVQIATGVKRTCLVSTNDDGSKIYLPVYNHLGLEAGDIVSDKIVSGHYYSVAGILWPATTKNSLGIEYELSWTTGFKDVTDEYTPVHTISDGREGQPKKVYGLDGRQRQQPRRGINIIRRQDGTITKQLNN
ncbi:MAG: M6 family metalloprotease domain-containing protein [Prevotella sp.]|nr:M6 family metalloprotease domain-containing protein [Prevotella sp.]